MPTLQRLLAVAAAAVTSTYACQNNPVVSSLSESNLHNAINNACAGTTVTLAAGTINATGQIVLNKDLIISGPVSTGAPLTTLQNNNPSKWNSETAGALGNRFFVVVNGAHLTLENITLSGGLGVGGNGAVSNSTMGGGGGQGMGGAPSAAPGSALTGYGSPNSQGHVDFLGADNHVRDLWYDTAWHLNDLTQAANAPIAVAGSALAGYCTFFNG